MPGMRLLAGMAVVGVAVALSAQERRVPDWSALDKETLEHFQALVRINTTDPPGVEQPAADYVKTVLERAGIETRVFALQEGRPNVVARLKGSGRKRPVLMMGHTDTVNIDEKKWTVPPFSAAREGGYIYGRGTVDDKDNLTAGLMTMIVLQRMQVPLDRDVIFLAESGEEGTTRVGIGYMVDEHFSEIDADYCVAEGGNVVRSGGKVKFAAVQTTEKLPKAIEIVSHGPAGHASVPLRNNAITHLARAVEKAAEWRPPIRLNETTRVYFERLASLSSPEDAARFRAILSADPAMAKSADDYFIEHDPRHASIIRSALSPTMMQAGYRLNVIPSEVKATLDVRLHPDDDANRFLEQLRAVINDPAVDVNWAVRSERPPAPTARLDAEAFRVIEAAVKEHYETVTLPTLGTGATDMAFLRARGTQCYGIGPAVDEEDGLKGFGAHSDQERILESELYRFVRFQYSVVSQLAASK
jgi:acetylornithine deacetylase/succinyl-diaminopimelate desuccinylase-like protein